MKAINMKCMVAAAVLLAEMIAGAERPRLELRGKTITIYPVLLRQLNQEESAVQAWRHGSEVARNLGVTLEQWGMLPHVSATEFPVSMLEEDLTESVHNSGAFSEKPLATDFALILLFEVKDADGKPLASAQAVMTDLSGRVVWVLRSTGFSSTGNMWPHALSHQITESLLPVSDLEKPERIPGGDK